MNPPANPPMGRLDAIEIGEKKLTVQTEFFHNPEWHTEIKVYFGGELKKVFRDDLSAVPEEELQKKINELHQLRLNQIKENLLKKSK